MVNHLKKLLIEGWNTVEIEPFILIEQSILSVIRKWLLEIGNSYRVCNGSVHSKWHLIVNYKDFLAM